MKDGMAQVPIITPEQQNGSHNNKQGDKNSKKVVINYSEKESPTNSEGFSPNSAAQATKSPLNDENQDIESEPNKIDGATNNITNKPEVTWVTKLDKIKDDDIDNDDVELIGQQALALTPIRQNSFLQNDYWELLSSAAKK